MADQDIQTLLEDLAKANADAIQAYERALSDITDPVIRARLSDFLSAHQDHMADLAREIEVRGGTPASLSKGLKGHVVSAVTALHHTAAGMKGVLHALKSAEERTTRLYGEAVPIIDHSPLRDMLRQHLSRTNNHLEYIKINMQAM
jgi:rubrerythrin